MALRALVVGVVLLVGCCPRCPTRQELLRQPFEKQEKCEAACEKACKARKEVGCASTCTDFCDDVMADDPCELPEHPCSE